MEDESIYDNDWALEEEEPLEPPLSYSCDLEFYNSRLEDGWEASEIHKQREDQSGQIFYLVQFTRTDHFHWVEEEEIDYVNGGPEALLKYEAKLAQKQKANKQQPSSRYSPSSYRPGGSGGKKLPTGNSKTKKKPAPSTQGLAQRYQQYQYPYPTPVPAPTVYIPYRPWYSQESMTNNFPAPFVLPVFLSNLYLNCDFPPPIKPVIVESPDEIPTMREFASAIQTGDIARVRDMIARGAKINNLFGFLGESGRLPLGWAAHLGHAHIVELLIRSGADIEARDGSSAGVFDCCRTRPVKRFFLILTAPPRFYRRFMAIYALGLQTNMDAVQQILRQYVRHFMASEKPKMVIRGNNVMVFENKEGEKRGSSSTIWDLL